MESRLSKRWTHNGRSREHEHDTGLRQRMSKMNLNDSIPENEPIQGSGKDFLNGKPRTNIRSDQPNTSANNGRTIASNHSSNTKTSDAETMIIVLNEFELTDEDEEKLDSLGGTILACSELKVLQKIIGDGHVVVLVASTDGETPLNHLTPSFLVALSKPTSFHLVTHKWLHKSLAKGRFLPTDKYLLLHDSTAETIDLNPHNEPHYPLRQAIENGITAEGSGGILAGYNFYLCNDISSDGQDPKTLRVLSVLLITAGAKRLTGEMEMTEMPKTIVIRSLTGVTQDEVANDLVESGATPVTYMVIFDVLSKQDSSVLDNIQKVLRAKKQATEKMTTDTAPLSYAYGNSPEVEITAYVTTLDHIYRSVSQPGKGDVDRALLGTQGTLQIVRKGSVSYVKYFDQDGTLKFKSKAPSKSEAREHMFGNAGKQNCLAWDTFDESKSSTMNVIYRRFYFWFNSRQSQDTFLGILIGMDIDQSTKKSILEEWYDEEGAFFATVDTVLDHAKVHAKVPKVYAESQQI